MSFWLWKLRARSSTVPQIPQGTRPIFHNASFCNRNVQIGAHFSYSALWDIFLLHVWFVRWVCNLPTASPEGFIKWKCISIPIKILSYLCPNLLACEVFTFPQTPSADALTPAQLQAPGVLLLNRWSHYPWWRSKTHMAVPHTPDHLMVCEIRGTSHLITGRWHHMEGPWSWRAG